VQFDVFVNPIVAARGAYPYVVVLQSDFAQGARDQIVAPAVPRKSLAKIAGRLTPVVVIDSAEHVVLVPALAGVRRTDLKTCFGSAADARTDLLSAIDTLFFGV
jgi:CcdB protein